jgi:hypothetical protein
VKSKRLSERVCDALDNTDGWLKCLKARIGGQGRSLYPNGPQQRSPALPRIGNGIIGIWEFHLGIQILRVAVDENEVVVEAQNSCAVVFAPRSCQSRAEDRSSETLTVNQLSANRSTILTNLEFGAESRVLQKSGNVSSRPAM